MTGVYPNWIWPANQNPLTGGCQPGATQIKPTGASLTGACKNAPVWVALLKFALVGWPKLGMLRQGNSELADQSQ